MPDPDALDRSVEGWWARKRAETDLLRRFLPADASAGRLADTPPDRPIEAQLRAARELRVALRMAGAARAAERFETAQEPHDRRVHPVEAGTVAYHYQRYDLALEPAAGWLSLIHGRSPDGRAEGGMLTSSGMAAITALLAALGPLGITRLAMSPWCYFETHLLLSTYLPGLEVTLADPGGFDGRAEVAWLDTSSAVWPAFPEARGALRLLVVDTACVEPDAPIVDAWLAAGRRLGIPVALVRSHLKLDTFGVELGKLGSLVVVGPDDDEAAIDPVLEGARRARAWMGLGFELPHLYPWLGDAAFHRLAARRTAGIRAMTAELADAIEAARQPGDGYRVDRTAHGLFCRVRTAIPYRDPTTWSAHELAGGLAHAAADRDLPAFMGSSFAMDRVALSEFREIRDGDHYLRVSGADLPAGALPGFGRLVRDAIAQLRERETS